MCNVKAKCIEILLPATLAAGVLHRSGVLSKYCASLQLLLEVYSFSFKLFYSAQDYIGMSLTIEHYTSTTIFTQGYS